MSLDFLCPNDFQLPHPRVIEDPRVGGVASMSVVASEKMEQAT